LNVKNRRFCETVEPTITKSLVLLFSLSKNQRTKPLRPARIFIERYDRFWFAGQ
jgi:hypothetical protein